MSLIQDALEKAGSPEPEPPVPAAVVPEEPRLQTRQFYETVERKSETQASPGIKFHIPFNFNQRFLAFAGMLILASLLAGRFFIPSFKPQPSVSGAISALPSPQAIVKTKTPVTQKTLSQTKFLLTGITSSEDGMPLALINNQVVGVGESLREKAMVKSISNESVTLEYEGREITLTL